jgi:hypothetical protein
VMLFGNFQSRPENGKKNVGSREKMYSRSRFSLSCATQTWGTWHMWPLDILLLKSARRCARRLACARVAVFPVRLWVFSPKRIPNWYYSLGQLGTLERKSRHFFFFFLRSCPIGLSLVYLSLLTGRKRERER